MSSKLLLGNIPVYGVIYKITNKINNKSYIGQTKRGFSKRYTANGEGIERVYFHHKNNIKYNLYGNIKLIRAIEKYGFANFDVIEIFDIAFSEQELNIKEEIYISKFDCINNGYNFREGGYHSKFSNEVCKKKSEKMKGKNNPNFGKNFSYEQRLKMSLAHKGIFSGENHPLFGKHHSEETKNKIRAKNSGNMHPKARKVICITFNTIFGSIKDAANFYNINPRCISSCCKHKYTHAGNLKWMYYDEFKKTC